MSDPWRYLTVSASQQIGTFRGKQHGQSRVEVYRDFDFWLAQTGHGTVYLDGRSVDFGGGMVVLATPQVPIQVKLDSRKPLEMCWAHFDCYLKGQRIGDARRFVNVDKLTLSLPGTPPIALVGKVDSAALGQQFLTSRGRLGDDVTQMQLNIRIMEVLMRLRWTHARPHEVDAREPAPLERAVAYMNRHIDEPIELTAVAEHVGVSLTTLRRLFARQLRTSPGRYLRHIRMARAQDLLRSPDFNISEVSDACGFGSLSHFSRAFKSEHGMSPCAFRRHMHVLP